MNSALLLISSNLTVANQGLSIEDLQRLSDRNSFGLKPHFEERKL